MKKIFSFLIVFTLFCSVLTFGSYSEQRINVLVNGKQINFDVYPYIDQNNRTLVPVRFIAENLGATVDYKEEIKQVTIKTSDKQIKLITGQTDAYVNGKKIVLDTKSIIKDGRTLVPVRFIAENLGVKVSWNEMNNTIELKTKDYKEPTDNIKNATDFSVRPITDFIDKGIPKSITDEGERVNIEKVYIASHAELPLKIGNRTIYSIEKIKKDGEMYVAIKTDKYSLGLTYLKNGIREGVYESNINFIQKDGSDHRYDIDKDGKHVYYYNTHDFFRGKDKYKAPNVDNSDYIVLSNSLDEIMVLIDNPFKK